MFNLSDKKMDPGFKRSLLNTDVQSVLDFQFAFL